MTKKRKKKKDSAIQIEIPEAKIGSKSILLATAASVQNSEFLDLNGCHERCRNSSNGSFHPAAYIPRASMEDLSLRECGEGIAPFIRGDFNSCDQAEEEG